MIDQLLTGGFLPFTFSLALLLGLLGLEIVFALLGGTLLGMGGEAPDVPDMGPEMDADLDGFDLSDLADLELEAELADTSAEGPDMPDQLTGGLAAWLGFGRMPMAIWLASMLMAFGLSGLSLQWAATALLGAPLPGLLAALPAGAAALWFTGRFGALFARAIPKTETQALSERHLGRRRGVVSQGTAARNRPAEVRVTDRYGNTHYLRAEPLRDTDEIAQGSAVIVLRHQRDGGYFLVALTDTS